MQCSLHGHMNIQKIQPRHTIRKNTPNCMFLMDFTYHGFVNEHLSCFVGCTYGTPQNPAHSPFPAVVLRSHNIGKTR